MSQTTPEVASLYGGPSSPKRIRVHHLLAAKERGERWPMLTSYDQYTASIFDEAGIPVLLVGDSASNNVYGNETTLAVTLDELIPLIRAVSRSTKRALVIGDLPFGSYEAGPEQALASAVRMMKEGGAHAVTEAGAFAVVLEMVPGDVAKRITAELTIPTIGIGAGPETDAQVLVWQDMAGLRTGHAPRFVKAYADLHGVLSDATKRFADEVRGGVFPSEAHTFQ